MNENINLVEILKDAPKGTKLWSPMFGDCYFEEYQKRESTYPLIVRFTNHHKETDYRSLSVYGKAVEVDSAECVIFPSKNNRDWSTFKAPWKRKHFEPFQKVLISSLVDTFPCKEIWVPVLYGYYDEETKAHILTNGSSMDDNGIIPYEGNEDKLGKQVEK